MKHKLAPHWTEAQLRAGRKMGRAWEKFFAAEAGGSSTGGSAASGLPLGDNGRIDDILRRHEAGLLRCANVVAVAKGLRMAAGKPGREACITVYVQRKLAEADLAGDDILPKAIEGVPVDVVEAGEVKAL